MIAVVPRAGTWIETCTYRSITCRSWSFPVRERGLKRRGVLDGGVKGVSFPVRERGLKHDLVCHFKTLYESFPVRERGLKHTGDVSFPSTGWSFPVRERGLKPVLPDTDAFVVPVVPRAGTWIETERPLKYISALPGSFPVRERGLKLFGNL